MNETPQTEFTVGMTLADVLARSGPLPLGRGLQLVCDIARQVQSLHAQGWSHRSIRLESVAFDSQGKAILCPIAPQVPLGTTADPELFPHELSCDQPISLPAAIEHARAELQAHGIDLDPRQIDIYQLSVMACRLLTGHGISDYLRSATVKGSLPVRACTVIDDGLGFNPHGRYTEIDQLINGISSVLSDYGVAALPNGSETSTSVLPPGATEETTVASGSIARREREVGLPFHALGHYTILERVGHGGMGDVYRAHDRSLNRTVALKVLPAGLARQTEFIARFKTEATAAARLSHPNIVQIYSIDEDAGYNFFTMQFVDGPSLADLLRQRRQLPVDETLDIVRQLLAGLAAAHRQGLVHRDIKPANILIDQHRRALLADFGLVKSLGSNSGQTATGVVLGTVDYLSPEQGRGRPVDQRSDLYSIGVLMYRMLSGRLPFEADSPTAMVFQHVYEVPQPLLEAAPDVSQSLADIITKLMSKEPSDRYASAEAVLEELAARRRQPDQGADRKPINRRRWVAAPLLVAVTLVAAAMLWRRGSAPATSPPAITSNPAGSSGAQSVEAAVELETGSADLAPNEIRRFSGHSEAVLALAISTDGSTLLSGSRDRSAAVWDVSTGERRSTLQGHNLAVRAIRFLPGEKEVVTAGSDHVLRRWDLQSGKTLMIYSGHSNEVASVAVREDGERFVSGSYDAGIILWERDRPTPRWVLEYKHESDIPPLRVLEDINALEAHTTWVRSVAFSPSGRYFVSGGNEALLAVWDAAERTILRRLIGHTQPISQVIYAADGQRVISSSFDASIRIWDAESGEQIALLSGHRGPVLCLAVSPDERWLATGSPDLTLRVWSLENGTQVQQFEGHTGQIEAVLWSPDGASVFSASDDRTIRQWKVDG